MFVRSAVASIASPPQQNLDGAKVGASEMYNANGLVEFFPVAVLAVYTFAHCEPRRQARKKRRAAEINRPP